MVDRFESQFKGGSLAEAFILANSICGDVLHSNPTFSATIPIILNPENGKGTEAIGSGVLLRIVDRVFLLTAAHVTDRWSEGTLMIPGRDRFIPVQGSFACTKLPDSAERREDALDIAYVWLDADCVKELHPDCQVLERGDASLECRYQRNVTYTFAGYPWRKSKSKDGEISTEFYTMSGFSAPISDYETSGLDTKSHIAIRFRRQKVFYPARKKIMRAPHPAGMSGGGAYFWSPEVLSMTPSRLPLAGVVNAYYRDRSLLVATRLHVYVACIFHNQPDLARRAGVSPE